MRFASRVRIGRWPRRLAALSCLALAALAAVRPAAGTKSPPRASLAAGQRAVPITVASDPHAYLSVGSTVELLATPNDDTVAAVPASAAVVAATAVVLSLPPPAQLSDGWPLVVGVDEPTARRIAANGTHPLLAVTGNPP